MFLKVDYLEPSCFQDEQDDHPNGVGSPLGTLAMEMTPGQMMEAEMSASGCLLDDVMMGPTGDCGVDPDTTDLLMSGLTDEPLFSGNMICQLTSCLFEKLLSVSAMDHEGQITKLKMHSDIETTL